MQNRAGLDGAKFPVISFTFTPTLMSPLNLHTATLDDMVFEGRNQAYGAFLLRRLYHRHLTAAILLASAACLLLVGVPFVVERVWPTVFVLPDVPDGVVLEVEPIILPKLEQQSVAPPARARVRPAVVAPPVTETVPVVVPETKKTVAPPQEVPLPTEMPAVAPIGGAGAAGTLPDGAPGGTGTAATGTGTGIAEAGESSAPFSYVETMPTFVGGEEALRKYLQHNLRYPPEALRNGIAGKVFVSFVVSATGAITDVEVVKGLGYGTDAEARRVISAMPAWTPGRQNHRAVAVRYALPITFRYE